MWINYLAAGYKKFNNGNTDAFYSTEKMPQDFHWQISLPLICLHKTWHTFWRCRVNICIHETLQGVLKTTPNTKQPLPLTQWDPGGGWPGHQSHCSESSYWLDFTMFVTWRALTLTQNSLNGIYEEPLFRVWDHTQFDCLGFFKNWDHR